MNSNEVMQLLALVSQYQYMNMSDVDSAKVTVFAWSSALDEDMPLKFALEAVSKHYASPTLDHDKLVPGHLNRKWHDEKKARHSRAIAAGSEVGDERVPMPEWFKAAMWDAFGTTDMAKAGANPKRLTGDQIQAIFDSAAQLGGHDPAAVRRGLDAHCDWTECRCSHSAGCYRGWLDNDQGVAVACPNCRPGLSDMIRNMPDRGQRKPSDTAVLGDKNRDSRKWNGINVA